MKIFNYQFSIINKSSLKAISYKLKADEGITLYLAIITMSGALAIALFMSSVFIKELRISQDIVNSIKAVYVADTVMEYALYQARINAAPFTNLTNCSGAIPGLLIGAQCTASSSPAILIGSDPQCTAAATCTKITASGAYGGVNRKIEIVYPNL